MVHARPHCEQPCSLSSLTAQGEKSSCQLCVPPLITDKAAGRLRLHITLYYGSQRSKFVSLGVRWRGRCVPSPWAEPAHGRGGLRHNLSYKLLEAPQHGAPQAALSLPLLRHCWEPGWGGP